ncbi:MAG: trypsin [Pseudoxanthomonas spadix]|nr:MAG: trypsin [Pseudoxanthomonas spadix]
MPKYLLALAAVVLPASADCVVIRHDVPDARYRVPDNFYPPLADLPIEGHGVLIASSWVVTAAHAVSWQSEPIKTVTIAGRERRVARVFVNPGFEKPPADIKGDAAPLMALLLRERDIALIELSEPVTDVTPAPIYSAGSECGKRAEIIGKGATGNGKTGQADDAPHRTVLRRAFNRIDGCEGAWLTYQFDGGRNALPLEGMLGNGDSGGPVLIKDHGIWKLAGLASWKWWDGDIAAFRAGIYGQRSYQVRLSYYRDWLKAVMAGKETPN